MLDDVNGRIVVRQMFVGYIDDLRSISDGMKIATPCAGLLTRHTELGGPRIVIHHAVDGDRQLSGGQSASMESGARHHMLARGEPVTVDDHKDVRFDFIEFCPDALESLDEISVFSVG